jgi:hypothetical protein
MRVGSFNWGIKELILYTVLVINDFNEGRLIVIRGLKPMEIYHSCSNIGKPTTRNIVAEPDTRCQSRTSNCNWHLNKEQKIKTMF